MAGRRGGLEWADLWKSQAERPEITAAVGEEWRLPRRKLLPSTAQVFTSPLATARRN
jgi:hypothetical protein